MNGVSSWFWSTAIHGVLLLGAAVTAIDHFLLREEIGSGFSCRLVDPTPRIDRIERPKDLFEDRIPIADSPAKPEVYGPAGISWNDSDGEGWFDCCVCGCGGATTTLAAWPRDIRSYFDRKLSMATSRRGAPRLKTHGRRCPFQETGVDADCTCGLIPPRS